MPVRRAILIVNPRARLARRQQWRDIVSAVLRNRLETELAVPTGADDTSRVAREAASHGFDIAIAAGGDGTINAVVRGLLGTSVPLGILPLGCANDLAREVGVPTDLEAATERILSGRLRALDVVDVNGRPFLGVGGLALVARSALAVTALKDRVPAARRVVDLFGASVYRLSATANLLGRRRISDTMRITYREPANDACREVELRVAALFVTNHRTTGGGLVLPVDADPRDGIFELCVVAERRRHSLLVNFARLSAGASLPPGVLVPLAATHALIETNHDDAFVADGDLLATGRRFDLHMISPGVQIIS